MSTEGKDWIHTKIYTKVRKRKWYRFWEPKPEDMFIAVGPD